MLETQKKFMIKIDVFIIKPVSIWNEKLWKWLLYSAEIMQITTVFHIKFLLYFCACDAIERQSSGKCCKFWVVNCPSGPTICECVAILVRLTCIRWSIYGNEWILLRDDGISLEEVFLLHWNAVGPVSWSWDKQLMLLWNRVFNIPHQYVEKNECWEFATVVN